MENPGGERAAGRRDRQALSELQAAEVDDTATYCCYVRDTGKVFVAMVSWHAVIGIGEAVITFLVVASVVGVRPDLVYGARSALRARTLEIRETSPR